MSFLFQIQRTLADFLDWANNAIFLLMTTTLSVKYEASYSFLKNKQNTNWSINDFEIGMCNNIMRASKIKSLPFDIFFGNNIWAWLYVEDLLRKFLTGPAKPEGLGGGTCPLSYFSCIRSITFSFKRLAGLVDQAGFCRTVFTGLRVRALEIIYYYSENFQLVAY